MMKLVKQLDKAQYIRFDEKQGIVYAWYGGHGVNIYSANTGDEIDYYSLGGDNSDNPKFYQAKASIDNRVKD